MANLELCETDPELAFRVNSLGTEKIAKECAEHNIPLVYISTEAVYSGKNRNTPYTEADIPENLFPYMETENI